jgi:hypothetical protein
MWKIIGIIVAVLIGGFVLIQLLPIGKEHINPPVVQEPNWDSPQTRELAMAACGDCHSNQTIWPAYSKIAPVSWVIANHVEEGRSKFNFSEATRRQESDEAASIVNEGEMPPTSYKMMHKGAQLTAAEKDALVKGLQATFGGDTDGERNEEDERD